MTISGRQPYVRVLATVLLLSVAAGAVEDGVQQLDLTKATIHEKLSALPADDRVLIEFFASWCPACRAFKPEYEKAARFLIKHSSVRVFRLDCATDPDVCDKYKVGGYPTMYAGRAADVGAVALDKLEKFEYGKYSRDGAGVVKFVAKHFGLDLAYSDEPQPATEVPASAGDAAEPAIKVKSVEWTAADVEAATQQLFTSIIAFHPATGVQDRRGALLLLLKLWTAGHPLSHCRAGSAALLKQLPSIWPENANMDPWGVKDGQDGAALPTDVCAAAGRAKAVASSDSWVACKGTLPDARGYTCGLWLTFHATAARLSEKDGGALLVSALKGFAQHFFQCEVCRRHFVNITSSPEAVAVRTRRDGVLWLWKAHNEVNARLQQVETKYGHSSTGDPAFPKVQWPTAAECPLCRLPSLQDGSKSGSATSSSSSSPEAEWNEEELYRFLNKWYGRQVSSVADLEAAAEVPSSQGSSVAKLATDAAADPNTGFFSSLTSGWLMLAVPVCAVVLWALRLHLLSAYRSGRRHGPLGRGHAGNLNGLRLGRSGIKH